MKIKQANELIKDNLIVKHYAGSIAYGTNLPTSDVDFRGIFVADPINVRTPFFRIEECKDVSEEDTVVYELSQYMKLALENNPNVLETLFIDPSDIVFDTPAYQHLRQHNKDFLCTKVAFTTTGYAMQQLKRLKGHHKHINNPQSEIAPRQTKYVSLVHNFTEQKMFKINLENFHIGYRLVPYSHNTYGLYQVDGYESFEMNTGNLNTTFEGDTHTVGTPLFIVKFNKDEYNVDKDKWQNYWTWKKNRNPVRAELEEKFNMDCKHAMHLVRLLNTGVEVLTTGEYIVKRPDAVMLLDIRNGKWTYDQLIEYAEDKDRYIREVLYKTSLLPKTPNIKLAAKIMMEVQDMVWGR